MASRFLDKEHGADTSTAIANDSTGTAKVRNLPDAAGIVYDSVDGFIKYNDAGTIRVLVNTSEGQVLTTPTPVAYTAGTSLPLTQALHASRVVYVTDVASAYVLPAATGTGDKYVIVLGATQTGAGTIKVASASDVLLGTAILFQDAGDAVIGFNTAADSDTIDLLGTGNSTGGMIGAQYAFIDVAAGKWAVQIVSDAAGTEATPFSATV